MIQLYGNDRSRATRNIWMLEELGIDYERKMIDHVSGETKRTDFIAINPGGKVPALTDGNVVMFESLAINIYLAMTYGKGSFWPDDNIVQNTELDFKIKATDPEDSNLIFRWDVDLSTDSNNDGDKRNDWIIGAYDTTTNEAKMSYTYSTPGVYTVMVQVLNSENRKLELTHSVAVSQAPPSETSSMVYFAGGFMLLGLLAVGGFVAWKNIQKRIKNEKDLEFKEAKNQVKKIATFRLKEIIN